MTETPPAVTPAALGVTTQSLADAFNRVTAAADGTSEVMQAFMKRWLWVARVVYPVVRRPPVLHNGRKPTARRRRRRR